jgi:hypothetical protein
MSGTAVFVPYLMTHRAACPVKVGVNQLAGRAAAGHASLFAERFRGTGQSRYALGLWSHRGDACEKLDHADGELDVSKGNDSCSVVPQQGVCIFGLSVPEHGSGQVCLVDRASPGVAVLLVDRLRLLQQVDRPFPFAWTKTADQIIDRIRRYCSRISGPGH